MATISRLLKIVGLFFKRALQKRLHSAKETYTFKESTNRSHPICAKSTNAHIQTQARANLALGSLSGEKCHDFLKCVTITNVCIETQARANLTLIRPLVGSFRGEKYKVSLVRAPFPSGDRRYVAVCCSVLQCVAVCCSML